MKPSWEKQESSTPREPSTASGMTGSRARDSMSRKRGRVRKERRRGKGRMAPDRP
jgi:hypothetical protein